MKLMRRLSLTEDDFFFFFWGGGRVVGITSLTYLYFAFEDHPDLEVIGVDGGYVKPRPTSHIEIHSGQRYSFLLKTKTRAELEKLGRKRDFWARVESRWRPARVQGAFVLRYEVDQENLKLDHQPGSRSHQGLNSSRLDSRLLTGNLNPDLHRHTNVSRAEVPPLDEFKERVPLPDEGEKWLGDLFEPLNPHERAPTAGEVTRRIIISGQQLKTNSGSIQWFVNGQSVSHHHLLHSKACLLTFLFFISSISTEA